MTFDISVEKLTFIYIFFLIISLSIYFFPEFVSDSEQEEAPLQTRDEGLSDQLLEALGVQLAPHLADALSSGSNRESNNNWLLCIITLLTAAWACSLACWLSWWDPPAHTPWSSPPGSRARRPLPRSESGPGHSKWRGGKRQVCLKSLFCGLFNTTCTLCVLISW